MADIFDEVSEELKQDQLKKIWHDYSKYIISISIILFAFGFGYFFYDKWKIEKLEVSSSQFFSGLEKLEEKKFQSILKLWQTRSYDRGAIIKFSGKKGEIKSGIFLGLDEMGGLMVRENSGIKKIYSGDVYFGS